jgi:GH35 family endo-1,4-beta-xylanase
VLCWGITDRHSWATRARPAARPLPLDAALGRKPMWHALAAALAGRPWPGRG